MDAEGGGEEIETGAETMGGDEDLGLEPAAESYKIERDLPLILENKGLELPNLKELAAKSNKEIKDVQNKIDDLLDE